MRTKWTKGLKAEKPVCKAKKAYSRRRRIAAAKKGWLKHKLGLLKTRTLSNHQTSVQKTFQTAIRAVDPMRKDTIQVPIGQSIAMILQGAAKLIETAKVLNLTTGRITDVVHRQEELFTSREVCRAFGIRPQALGKLIKDHGFKPAVVGGRGKGVQHKFDSGEVARLFRRMIRFKRRAATA